MISKNKTDKLEQILYNIMADLFSCSSDTVNVTTPKDWT